MATIGACGLLNSCQLGAANYSGQTEVETEVPESLEQGKPSQGPPPGQTAHLAHEGVPTGSDLIDPAETLPSTTNLPALPTSSATGGAPITSNSSEISRNLIDIPKPEFAAVSVHTPRTPANMLTLDRQPLGARATLNAESRPDLPIVQDSIPSLPPDSPVADPSGSAPANAEIASGPKVSPADPPEPVAPAVPGEAGIPLLHSSAKLSDFYAALHQPLLDHATVDNTTLPAEAVPAAAPEEAELPPPPPPAETAFGSPAPQ